ncbi:glycoside hydrolase family 35 protein [Crepidotus variabilis]|uniref:Beta-galactosidase n=1 Tax=Crepidotus variabilis TaxID=179855 RepID=A0A9P6ECF7_9AGAR|nr:glycoside hydrolase family 35 protein [Crepidotus variabilis]
MRYLATLYSLLCLATLAFGSGRSIIRSRQATVSLDSIQSNGLQNIVTWDKYSFFINGKRLMLFGGEVHPYRLPVASLYLDVFQKIKSTGMNVVSFYVFWGILEPKRGEISFEGFRNLQPFFDAAKKAGIYLVARPGPYINAETTAGGFPGWGSYTAGLWRTSNQSYFDAYTGYIKTVGQKIADNQITKGGPVILVQSENEYSSWKSPYAEDKQYEQRLKQAFIDVGITVPITTNDAHPNGHYTSVDVWGYDSYPNNFDCSHPTTWSAAAVPENFWSAHLQYTPNIPNAVYEFQGGAFDGWGGSGYETCAILTGSDFERGMGLSIISGWSFSDMILSLLQERNCHVYDLFESLHGVYTSYDYGSAITEDRRLRDKYYELKLIGQFLAVSPAYLTMRPQNIGSSQGKFTGNQALKTTQLLDVVGNQTAFYVVRQTDASLNSAQKYTLTVSTSIGNVIIPSIGGSLTLNGKDSKIHLVDYLAGTTALVYSSAEISTWETIDGKDVILLYGGTGELHETAIKTSSTPTVVSGSGTIKTKSLSGGVLAIQYITSGQTVVQLGNTVLYLLDRANAYQFWSLQADTTSIIVKGGYLLRSAKVEGGTLALTGDLNSTTSFEIIAPSAASQKVTFNGVNLEISKTAYGTLTAKKSVTLPDVKIPDLTTLTWKKADSLPEISTNYSDAAWTTVNRTSSINPTAPTTPVVLYAGEYGYHTGNILWRAHFTATGSETAFKVKVSGGAAFAHSVWLDSTFLGSWEGDVLHANYEGTYSFPAGRLTQGSAHVITILQDHMGYEEDGQSASDKFKSPRGILSYSFEGSSGTKIDSWKVTGNLGGENYIDKTRGPLNEGGLYAERQGWHLPGFDDASWVAGKPTEGLASAGVAFFRTSFDLNVPVGVDYPISIAATNSTTNPYYRAQFYVNGYQFGKYINSIGPQKVFPVPQGILNYQGTNTLAISLWAAKATGARLDTLKLQLTAKIESAMQSIILQPAPAWSQRKGAY